MSKADIGSPNTFEHVLHMGPEAMVFGSPSAMAKTDLNLTTPGNGNSLQSPSLTLGMV
jgi:hypothetical protein